LRETRLSIELVPELTIASVALEAYGVDHPDEFPNTDRTIFTPPSLSTEDGPFAPNWELGDYVTDDRAHAELEEDGSVAIIYRS
jgi:hypothetical protein